MPGLLAAAMLLVACGSDDAGDTGTTTSAPAATAGSQAPRGGSTVLQDVLATYSRSGGIAGVTIEVVVRPDGTFEGVGDKPGRGRLAASGLDELKRLVDAFVKAKPRSSYGEVVPDGFVTRVTAAGTSTTVLTQGEPPEPVARLVGFLAGLERQLPP
jgi:hypothetical protein